MVVNLKPHESYHVNVEFRINNCIKRGKKAKFDHHQINVEP